MKKFKNLSEKDIENITKVATGIGLAIGGIAEIAKNVNTIKNVCAKKEEKKEEKTIPKEFNDIKQTEKKAIPPQQSYTQKNISNNNCQRRDNDFMHDMKEFNREMDNLNKEMAKMSRDLSKIKGINNVVVNGKAVTNTNFNRNVVIRNGGITIIDDNGIHIFGNNRHNTNFENQNFKNNIYEQHKEDNIKDTTEEIKVNHNSDFMKNELLTKTEQIFFDKIREACKDFPVSIFPKVRLEDIIKAKKNSNEYSNRNKIKCRHIDFVVYNNQNYDVVLAIELDDHYHRNTQEADAFKNQIFKDSGIILERVDVKKNYDYDIQKIVNIIKRKLYN